MMRTSTGSMRVMKMTQNAAAEREAEEHDGVGGQKGNGDFSERD